MRVLTMAARKGGAGKTTLATSLAVAAVQAGEVVVAVDLDPQGSLREWSERREAQDIVFRPVEASGLDALLTRLRDHGRTTLAIVDTPGAFGPEVTVALRQSDLALLPVRPSLLDVTATRRTAEALDVLGRRYAFVLSQVQGTSPARAEEAAQALVEIGALFPGYISLRTDHLDAMMTGQGVTEYRPRGPAADEVRALWTWTRAKLETPA